MKIIQLVESCPKYKQKYLGQQVVGAKLKNTADYIIGCTLLLFSGKPAELHYNISLSRYFLVGDVALRFA